MGKRKGDSWLYARIHNPNERKLVRVVVEDLLAESSCDCGDPHWRVREKLTLVREVSIRLAEWKSAEWRRADASDYLLEEELEAEERAYDRLTGC